MEQLFDVLHRVTTALRAARIDYRVIGGTAVFLHISQKDPLAARVTRDVDLAVDRNDLARLADAVRPRALPIGIPVVSICWSILPRRAREAPYT